VRASDTKSGKPKKGDGAAVPFEKVTDLIPEPGRCFLDGDGDSGWGMHNYGFVFEITTAQWPVNVLSITAQSRTSKKCPVTISTRDGGFSADPPLRKKLALDNWVVRGTGTLTQKKTPTAMALDSPVSVPAFSSLGIYLHTPASSEGIAIGDFSRFTDQQRTRTSNGVTIMEGRQTMNKKPYKDLYDVAAFVGEVAFEVVAS
jgi:hypothetical protein